MRLYWLFQRSAWQPARRAAGGPPIVAGVVAGVAALYPEYRRIR
jgi:hypothetical protein